MMVMMIGSGNMRRKEKGDVNIFAQNWTQQ